MKRFPFLDWLRGLAVVIMILCHTFNAFARLDVREGGAYVLSQFVGGMAAPLFLFMAGMTLAFQMDSLDRRGAGPQRRLLVSLKRSSYILGIAYLFRITNWLGGLPHSTYHEILKVDILNCMGASLIALSLLALAGPGTRVQAAAAAGILLAAAAPLVSGMDWNWAPWLVKEYIVPNPSHFPIFPGIAYPAFGIAAGAMVKLAADRMDRLMQWAGLIGLISVVSAQYFSNIPYSLYPNSSFWIDSPALVFIRTGLCLLLLAGAYVWTEFGAGAGWSWMQSLGKTSLMAYWVHVVLVYGDAIKPLRRAMSIPETTAAMVVVTALMVALSETKLRWQARRAAARAAR